MTIAFNNTHKFNRHFESPLVDALLGLRKSLNAGSRLSACRVNYQIILSYTVLRAQQKHHNTGCLTPRW